MNNCLLGSYGVYCTIEKQSGIRKFAIILRRNFVWVHPLAFRPLHTSKYEATGPRHGNYVLMNHGPGNLSVETFGRTCPGQRSDERVGLPDLPLCARHSLPTCEKPGKCIIIRFWATWILKQAQSSLNDCCRGVFSMRTRKRAFIERRTGKDRRRVFSLKRLTFRRIDRRSSLDRRSGVERRENWIRVSRWSSAPLNHLKLSKYLLRRTSLTKNSPMQ